MLPCWRVAQWHLPRSAAGRSQRWLGFGRLPGTARGMRSLVSRACSRRLPTTQRPHALVGALPGEQRFNRHILVDCGPVNSEAGSDELPSPALARRRRRQARIPRERDGHDTAIAKTYHEGITRDLYVGRHGNVSSCRSTHARPLESRLRSRAPTPSPSPVPPS